MNYKVERLLTDSGSLLYYRHSSCSRVPLYIAEIKLLVCPFGVRIKEVRLYQPIVREIKHHVYGKRKLQKYHVIMSFPPFFTFAVCLFQREEACSCIRQKRVEYFFDVFDSFCCNCQPVLKPNDDLFIFLRKLTDFLSVGLNKREEKKCESEVMFGCQLRKGYQLFRY